MRISHPRSSEKGNWVGLFIESVPIVTAQMLAWNKTKLLAQTISSVHFGKFIPSQMFIVLSDTKRFLGLGCHSCLSNCLHISMPYFPLASDYEFVFQLICITEISEPPSIGVSPERGEGAIILEKLMK